MKGFDIPILFIIFNRLEYTKLVFEVIKKIRPKFLYVAADGFRVNVQGEEAVCKEVRNYVLANINWDCQLKTKFEEKNLGCAINVSTAISWIFKNEKWAIILEDDCVPSLAFFEYCKTLLQLYENDNRIWAISGLNHFNGKYNLNSDSYFFSKYASIWGWATWKRCWENYDVFMKDWVSFENDKFIFDHVPRKDNLKAYKLYKKFYNNNILKNRIHTWDVQFGFKIWSNRGIGIVPAKNLIMNIGNLGIHGQKKSYAQNLSIDEHFTIKKHPLFFQTNFIYDDKYFQLSRKKTLLKKFIKLADIFFYRLKHKFFIY